MIACTENAKGNVMHLNKTAGIFIVGLLLCGMLVSCKNDNPVNSPVPVKTELEGTWDGTNMDGIDQTQWTYTMALDSVFIDAGDQEKYRGAFALDTSAAPRHIDISVTKSAVAADIGKKIPALYNLSGNILQITANGPGSQRPASMDAAPVLKLTLRQ
jgi:uncharacterized protein (TIGR03067 family)